MSQAYITASQPVRSLIIAERARNIRRLLSRELSRDGYDITVISSGHELCRLLESQRAGHIVLLDPDLPDLEDDSVIRRLRAQAGHATLLIHSYGAQAYRPLADVTHQVVRRTGNIEALRATLGNLETKE